MIKSDDDATSNGENRPVDLGRLQLALQNNPGDHTIRLRLARQLADRGEWSTVDRIMASLEAALPLLTERDLWEQALAMLAHADEQRGDRERAARRWETLLANDIDHPEARGNLTRLQAGKRPTATHMPPMRAGGAETTLFSPEGASTSRYEIRSELGRGATSTVYLARDIELDILVALKVLHPSMHAAALAQARERFFWEARAAARLRHPGVVAIYDLDETTRSLAMEYLPAGTLREHLGATVGADATPQALSSDEIRATAVGLLDALAHVHAAGLVHGDLKPRNILLRRPGEPVLCDFGVSRLIEDREPARELPAGTPLYLAPEQLRGMSSSAATDLFAVGAVLWEMAAGHPMRTHADLTRGQYDPTALPEPARTLLEAASPALARMIDALVERSPEQRPASAEHALALVRTG